MESTIVTAFGVTVAALGALIVLAIATAIIHDYIKYKDLQRRLKRDSERKQKKVDDR